MSVFHCSCTVGNAAYSTVVVTVQQKRMTTVNWFGQFTARLENVGNCGLAIWLLLRVDLAVSGRNQPRLVWPVRAGVLYMVQRCKGERYKQKSNLKKAGDSFLVVRSLLACRGNLETTVRMMTSISIVAVPGFIQYSVPVNKQAETPERHTAVKTDIVYYIVFHQSVNVKSNSLFRNASWYVSSKSK